MTREEAITELKLFKESAIPWDVPTLLEAIDIAIEALKREDTMLKEIERVVLYGERGEANG